MPPQGVALVLGAGIPLGWNYRNSRVGKPTISMFLRRHPVAFVIGVVVANGILNGWLPGHILEER